MLPKIAIYSTLILTAFSFSSSASEQEKSDEKTVTVVIENRKEKQLPNDVDVFLASVVGGLDTVQKKVEKVGGPDCHCKISNDGAYLALELGTGTGSNGGDMQWRAFTLRLGKKLSENTRIDFVHINEGHLPHDHRDGVAIQATSIMPIDENLKLEVGAGPYFSMNTTKIKHKEVDSKELGVLGTVVLLYSLDKLYPGLDLRAEYNHVFMPQGIDTDSFLIGFGKSFDSKSELSSNKNELVLIGDHFKTNHGSTSSAEGYQIELKRKVTEDTDLSASYLHEGKDILVDRQGVAVQYWYSQKLPNNWTMGAGAGPYLATNKLEDSSNHLNTIISFEFKKEIKNDLGFFVRFNRISDFSGSNDRDMLGLGISKKFN